MKKALTSLLVAGSLLNQAQSAEISGTAAGYYDTRGFPTTTVKVFGSDLPGKTDFFGFVDSFGSKEKPWGIGSYGEFKLSKKLWQGIGPAIEYNRDFSAPTGVTRAGLVLEPDLHIKKGFVGVTFYPVSTYKDGMQLVLYGKKEFKDGRYYVDGFLDLNLKPQGAIPLGKIEVGMRLGDKKSQWYGVAEGRHDGFSKGSQQWGVGLGVKRRF
jgi:hypothetical protein